MGIEKPANVDCKGCHIEKNSKPSIEAKVQG